MNFLAHLWLADRTDTSMAGAILGDLVRGADLSPYPSDIALGIRLHRRIDASSDRHPLLQPLRAQFDPGTRRYAGIVLDLACDYALVQHWQQLSREPLPEFCARAGTSVAAAAPWFVQAGARAPTAAGFSELLLSYGEASGIDRAVRRTAARLRQPQPLIAAAGQWPRLTTPLLQILPELLQDLQQQVHTLRA